jgi:hypothetical protein
VALSFKRRMMAIEVAMLAIGVEDKVGPGD